MNTQRRNPESDPFSFASSWQRFWLPTVHSPRAVLEVVIGMAVVIALCFWLRPQDPLLLQTGFPWLALFALVFALRYGALLGVFAGACLLVAWWWLYGGSADFPKTYFVGVFVLLVLGGHFSDLWSGRLLHETGVRRYLDRRLVSVTNSHYLLRASYDRLEQELLSRPTTIRDSVARLRDLMDSKQADTALPQAQALLDYLAGVCQINEAAIYPMQGSELSTQALAHVGDSFALNKNDMLLRRSLETSRLSQVREAAESGGSEYLVCAPIRTSAGEVLGSLVVRRMLFMALNHDNLQLILVLLSYYADSVRQQSAIAAVHRKVPGCGEEFALELSRLSHLKAQGGPDSCLVAFTFRKNDVLQAAFDHLLRQRRALDLSWNYETPDTRVLVVLLALTGEQGIGGYVARVEDILRAQFGVDFEKSQVGVYSRALGSEDPGLTLSQFMDTWSQT